MSRGVRGVYEDFMNRPRVTVANYESVYTPPEGVRYGQAPWYMKYFDQMYGKTRKKEKSLLENPWLWVLGGVAVLGLLVYRAKAEKPEMMPDESGGGFSEILAGGSGDEMMPTVPDAEPVVPGVPQPMPSPLPQQEPPVQPETGSALRVFQDAYSGAQFATGNTVLSLHGDPVAATRDGSNPYGVTQLGFLNPESLNQGYGERTDVTGLANELGGLPVDYSGAGWATYWNVDENGNRTVEVRDGRLYQSNYADAVQEVFASPVVAGMTTAEKNAYAASVALGRSLESVGQLDTMGAADRARYEQYKAGTGSALNAQKTAQQAAVMQAKQTNATIAAKQAAEKEAARKAAEAARQAEANRQAAIAAQQRAQAAKSSGGSSGGSGLRVTSSGGKTGTPSAAERQAALYATVNHVYERKSSGGSSGGSSGRSSGSSSGKSSGGSSGSSSGKSSGRSYSVSTSSGTSSFTGSGGRFRH